ncbi:fimbrial protein [Rahnella sikkimica]|uniref:Oxidoreductase n=1 Tax=Rahnella sikkimica TaxID=1805933 RepID=A0A2L1UKH4_9GAMM|nr:fimbrial protein [Rahnella sikkimica]AVF33433.1 oxidoreductase [Rahnella sikkimica]
MPVILRLAAFALISGLIATPVSAYDVLVSVTGSLYGNTCTVSVDSKEITVPLGTIATRQFGESGAVSNVKTPFSINLEDCGPTFSGVKISFTGTPDTHNPELLKTEDNGATGVAVQLLDNRSVAIPLGTSTEAYGSAGAESVQMKFFARLAANGEAVNPGSVSAVATWVMEYQ